MMSERRVGSLTLGVSLVGFGILFLLRIFVDSIDYWAILKFWPVVFILLGVEILVFSLTNKGLKFKLDFFSVITVFFGAGDRSVLQRKTRF